MEKTKTVNTETQESRPRRPIKKVIIFALLNALVPLIALSFYAYLGQRETTINTAKKDATYISEVAANIYKEKILATKSILKTISKLPQITSGQTEACSLLMEDFLKEYPSYADLGVTNENGLIYCSALPFTQRVNVKDLPWYQETLKNEDFSAGLYQIGKITGQESVNFGYPVALAYPIKENGKISNVVFAALKLDWIEKTAENFSIPQDSTITVTDREGTVLARFPDGADFVGTNHKDNPLVEEVLAGGEAGSILGKGFDGIERYYSYVKIQESLSSGDFYLYIGIPQKFLTDNANKAFANSFVVILGIIALSILIIFINWKLFIDKKPISP